MTREGDRKPGDGPVPVRDLMRGLASEAAEAGVEGQRDGSADGVVDPAGAGAAVRPGHLFEMDDELWSARPAGVGAYGTGRTGAARLLAVHFHRQEEPDVPVREALVPVARFAELGSDELRALFRAASPIELDR